MQSRILEVTPRIILICLYYTVVASTIFAIFETDMEFYEDFPTTLLFTQCIGCSATIFFFIAHYFFRPKNQFVQMVMVVMCMIIGAVFGSFIGSLIAYKESFSNYFIEQQDLILHNIFYAVTIGSLAVYLYIFRQRIFTTEAIIKEEKIKRLSIEKKAAETNLKMLQAQIEPHFLFNTLSNILSLIDTDVKKGKLMMSDFIEYLRASLSKTRSEATTIGQEMATVRSYLNIIKYRMGDRLDFSINIPENLRTYSFPPMLIQPLVENAVRHGLEPKIPGGNVAITTFQKDDMLTVEVVDSGLGFNDNSKWGIGISNIKERLVSMYGDKGKLVFKDNEPSGVKAIIEIPYERD